MTINIKGYLVGLALSLTGVVAYIGIAFAGYILTVVPIMMAYLFYIGVHMFNKDQKSRLFYILLTVVTFVETLLALLIYTLIIALREGVSLSYILKYDNGLMEDGGISLLFAAIGVIMVIYEIKRKEKIAARNLNM